MKKLMCILLTGVFLVVISGCGSSEPTVDTAPFEKAITTYLSQKNMDMKVSKFKEVNLDGNKATAKCAMKAAAVSGPAVRWTFSFEKTDGIWIVTGLEQ